MGENDKISLKQPIQIECYSKPYFGSHNSIKLIKPIDFEKGARYIIDIDFDSNWKERTFFTKQRDGENLQIIKCLYRFSPTSRSSDVWFSD